jgi:mannose-6-phosphate isomerase-like protein (cupin superfamily)
LFHAWVADPHYIPCSPDEQGLGRRSPLGSFLELSMVPVINLAQKLSLFEEQWSPRVIADLNDCQVKLAKVQGEFVWHHHAEEDELFLVLKGTLVIELRDGSVTLGPGEMVVIPKGVEHRPVAAEEVHMMLVEPSRILHTGNVVNERTVHTYQRI